jgi:hypothetical protein
MSSLLTAIQAIAPKAKATDSITASRNEPDTIAEARAKVVAKLQANIEFIKRGMDAAASKKPDLVYKHNARANTYSVGAKYGNRWITGLADTGKKYIEGIALGELASVLNLICEHVIAGHVDTGILDIQKNNLAARQN